jgi:hypothetical protein
MVFKMALPKLPCEYKELGIKRVSDCFGDLSNEQKQQLLTSFEKCAKNLEKIRFEKFRSLK